MSRSQPHPYLPTLERKLQDGRISRREFLRTATLLGLSATAAYAAAARVTGESLAAATGTGAALPHGGKLRLVMAVQDVSNPHGFEWEGQHNVSRNVCEYLTKTGHDNITRPCLLEGWEASDDLRTWTLYLRKDVKWHSGRAFTADDVVWNFRHALDPRTGSSMQGLMKGYLLTDDGKSLWDADAVEKVDAYTVRLNCRAPQLAVPEHLFHYPFAMIDPEEGGRFGPGSNGTGAFELVEHEVGVRSLLRARQGYWGEGPHLDSLEFIDRGDDPAAVVDALAARRVDGAHSIDVVQLEALRMMPHLKLYSVATADTAVARGKVTRKPFDDPRVRKALRLAIDPRRTQQAVLGDLGLPAEHHHVAPIHPEYAGLPPPQRDVAAARALLAEAGYPNGVDLGEITCKSSPSWEFNAVQALVEQWKEAGIRCRVNLMPSPEFWKIWNTATFGFTEWAHRPLGVMALSLAYRSGVPWNESEYSNPEFDHLLTEAEGLLDPEDRRAVMARIERLLQEDGPIVQPVWRSVMTVMDERVLGFKMHPTRYIFGNELAVTG